MAPGILYREFLWGEFMRVICGTTVYDVKKAWHEDNNLMVITYDDKIIITECGDEITAKMAVELLFENDKLRLNTDTVIVNWKEYKRGKSFK